MKYVSQHNMNIELENMQIKIRIIFRQKPILKLKASESVVFIYYTVWFTALLTCYASNNKN